MSRGYKEIAYGNRRRANKCPGTGCHFSPPRSTLWLTLRLCLQDLRLKGVGGRVALVLRLGIGGGAEGGDKREVVVANTHLMFPHAR